MRHLEALLLNPFMGLAVALILAVIAWRMNAAGADWLLGAAWILIVISVFRTPPIAQQAFVQRGLFTMLAASIAGLGLCWLAGWKPAITTVKAITKTDGFTILIPIDTANQNIPIPLDENPKDTHRGFYHDLTFSIANRHPDKASGFLMLQEDQLFSDEGRPKFLGKLIQMYIFDSIFSMTRQSYGVQLSGGRVTALEDKAVIPPDVVSSSTESVITELSKRQLLTSKIKLSLDNFPLHMPKGADISFSEQVEGQSVFYVMRTERPGFFRFDLTVRPMGNSNEGVLPDGFQTQAASTVKTYNLIVAMESVIQVTDRDGFEPDKYVAWVQDTFAELRRRMTF